MMKVFDPSGMKPGKWYLIQASGKPRTVQFSGERGSGHFRTRCGFDYWCEPNKVQSGPYITMDKADEAWAKPSLRKYGGGKK